MLRGGMAASWWNGRESDGERGDAEFGMTQSIRQRRRTSDRDQRRPESGSSEDEYSIRWIQRMTR
jgi:hypothetical protein